MDNWEKVFDFPDTTQSFVLGFEAGRIWAELRAKDDNEGLRRLVSPENAELYIRMAEVLGRRVQSHLTTSDTWIEIEFMEKDGT